MVRCFQIFFKLQAALMLSSNGHSKYHDVEYTNQKKAWMTDVVNCVKNFYFCVKLTPIEKYLYNSSRIS